MHNSMNNNIHPKITLVGAGPGDPDLITRKGLKALRTANVLLYDALVAPELIQESPRHTLKIYVGKRANNHRYSQEEINLLMVQKAYQYGHVVRLKGGDPFVFGRGYEELLFAQAFGIEINVVPGISSCIAVPQSQGIPLTCRGINESFWVLTATTSGGQLAQDIKIAAQSSATVVILMGLNKLAQIVNAFQAHHSKDLPVMIVQNGTFENEQFVLGNLGNIEEKVRAAQIGTPALIVIGKVVNLHTELKQDFASYLSKYQIQQIKNGR